MDGHAPFEFEAADGDQELNHKRQLPPDAGRSQFRVLPGVVHVVSFPLDDARPGALEVLDDGERARAARLVFERDRSRFIAAHAYVRLLLGTYMGHAPTALRFTTTMRGKPRLIEPATDIRFNLSHSGAHGILAVSAGIEVGVDIEAEQPVAMLDLARRFFAPREVVALQTLPEAERASAFCRGWTRKEAFVKARGDGLNFPFHQFEVSLESDTEGPLLRSCSADADGATRWRLVSLAAPPGYAAALAAESGEWDTVEWTCRTNAAHELQMNRVSTKWPAS